jgi:hypothetical protein
VIICKGNWYAARIKQIFAYPSGLPSKLEAYFVIQRFKDLPDQEASRDPYHNLLELEGSGARTDEVKLC